ncbi:MAG TPA: endonuclease/exonuclease/phosphatase family protein [Parafilimonas sp.]|nr:endonuclease/exonuclease/phosphatase family protein [Parafilimonas sp.]
MNTHFLAWWNLENLFDVETSADRIPWLQHELGSYLKGWDETVLNKKVTNLSSIIAQLNGNHGPDIMGFCELENKRVVQLIAGKISVATGRSYDVVHVEMNDHRGIDIAFMYDTSLYTPEPEIFSHEVMKRTGTRDLLQVNFTVNASGKKLFLIGNHWPSRSGGQYESEPFRIMVGENLSYWIKRIMEIRGETEAIIVMGDLNDEPFNRSVSEYALGVADEHVIENAARPILPDTVHKPYLLNLMHQFLGQNRATFVFGNEKNVLDQFLVSRGLILNAGYFSVQEVNIVDFLPELVTGEYKKPVSFGAPSSAHSYNPEGFSDHLPIYMVIEEK